VQSLVFLHVPKTGGMSFEQLVLRQFSRRARLQADATDTSRFTTLWNALPAQRRAAIRCLHGHLPFGVHAVLPEPVRYVTLLRDPVERVVSAYYFALRRPEVPSHRELVRSGMSLHDYVTSALSADVHDAQTRALCGGHLPEDARGADSLARAQRHLAERFAVVGLCERFDETALLCRRALSWSNVHYVVRNRNRRRPRLADVPAPTVAAIRARNTLDLELYATTAARFAEVWAHPIASTELRAFRARNRLYGRVRRLLELPVGVARVARTAVRRALLSETSGVYNSNP
jgi:hypothetical protein